VRDFLVLRRLTDLDLDALGVLERLVDLRREALGVLERFLDRRRLGVRDFLGATSSASAFGALGVLARRADRRLDAFGVLDLLLDRLLDRRLGVLDFLAVTSSSTAAFGALGVLALRREADRLRLLLALGVLERRLVLLEAERLLDDLGVLDLFFDLFLERRRLGVRGFLGASRSISGFGAFGVLARRREDDFFLDAFGVLERRLVLREAERLLLDLGVLERLLARRRLGVLAFFASTASGSALGALGVLALRRELERRLEALGVLDRRRLDLREAERLLLDLGVFERLLARRRLGVLDFLASPSDTSGLGAFGVRARRRDEERRLEAFGVLDRRRETDRLLEALGVLERFFDRRRLGVRDFLDSSVFLGAFGVLARRFTALRPLEALGVLDLRRRRAERERLGVLDRLALRLGAEGVRGTVAFLAFLTGFEDSFLRGRFLIPISLFLFASMSALY